MPRTPSPPSGGRRWRQSRPSADSDVSPPHAGVPSPSTTGSARDEHVARQAAGRARAAERLARTDEDEN